MIILVKGHENSGKSAFAEKLIESHHKDSHYQKAGQAQNAPLIYLATMECQDKQGEERISRHKKRRTGKGYETIERTTNVGCVSVPSDSYILLECVINLVGNELFSENGCHADVPNKVASDIKMLGSYCRELCVVTGRVGSPDETYDEQTKHYIDTLEQTNQKLLDIADVCYEIENGQVIKRTEKG